MKYLSSSAAVSAAFVGPGSITVCFLMGYKYSYELIYTVLLSIFCTVVFQEMAARIAFARKKNLSEVLAEEKESGLLGKLLFWLAALAIIFGNAAYQSGNLSGTFLGLKILGLSANWVPFLVVSFILVLLLVESLTLLKLFLQALMLLFVLALIWGVFFLPIDWRAVFFAFLPKWPKVDYWLDIAGLMGTTLVPYNLFLQSSLLKTGNAFSLSTFRKQNILGIGIGGMISLAMILCSAALSNTVDSYESPISLIPYLNKYTSNLGFLLPGGAYTIAGITSSITAPLAAGLVAKHFFGSKWYAFTSIAILVAGFGVTFLSNKPVIIIQMAQVFNGLLLPIVTLSLLFGMQKYLSTSWSIAEKLSGYTAYLIVTSIAVVSFLRFFM